MIEVFVSRLGLDSASSSYVVVLQEKDGARLLPILRLPRLRQLPVEFQRDVADILRPLVRVAEDLQRRLGVARLHEAWTRFLQH